MNLLKKIIKKPKKKTKTTGGPFFWGFKEFSPAETLLKDCNAMLVPEVETEIALIY